MGLGEQQSENNNWYETSEQRQIDKYLVDDWMKKVYEQHKELGIDFDQSYQNQVNAATARINAFEAYQKERQQRLEQEAETQRLTQELNMAVGDVNEGLLRNGEAANRNAQQMAGEQQAKEGLRQLAENLTQAAAEAEQTPIPVLGATYSSTAVNLIIGSKDYGYVPAQVAYEEPADSSSVSIPEKSAIGSVIDAFKKGEFRIGGSGSGSAMAGASNAEKQIRHYSTGEIIEAALLVSGLGTGAKTLEALGSRVLGYFAKGSSKAKTVWDSIKATQPVYEGTQIPKSFEMAVGNQKYWVHPNATEHMFEYVTRRPTHSININSQEIMTSFQEAVNKAVMQGIKYGERITIDNWEFIFSAPRGDGLLPVIKHAQYIP